jgi:glycosyltransferase involved in cell wall biosynthesis
MTATHTSLHVPSLTTSRATRRPRILFVSPHSLHRMTGASEVRAVQTARALRQMGEVVTVVVDSEGWAKEWAALPDAEFRFEKSFPVGLHANNSMAKKLKWWFDARADYPHGVGVSRTDLDLLDEMAGNFDLLWFCKLRTANMFPRWAWRRSVTDIDDVPSTFALSDVQAAKGLKARLLARMRLASWRKRDRLLSERFDVMGVCSDADRQYLQALGNCKPLHVIPNGCDSPKREVARHPATPPHFGFIGIFDYPPNLEGAQWFVRECWPLIKRELPEARLRLVGRQSDGVLKPQGPDIDGLGFVTDPAEEIATWSAMVVPIRTGAGTRGKIAHAFSAKCPVVSTSLGAHGYEVRHGDLALIADDPTEFARSCIQLVRAPEAAEAMAQRAWAQFLQKWTWEAIQPRIWAAAEECLRLNVDKSGTNA